MKFRVVFLILFANLLRSGWSCIPPEVKVTSTSSSASSASTDEWSTHSTKFTETTISTKASDSIILTDSTDASTVDLDSTSSFASESSITTSIPSSASSTIGSTTNFDSTETSANEPSTAITTPSVAISTASDETSPSSALNTPTSAITSLSTLLTTAPTTCDCSFPGPVNIGNPLLSKLKHTKTSSCSFQILCDQNSNQNYLEAEIPPNFEPNQFNLKYFRFYPVFNSDNTPIDYFSQFGMVCDDKEWYITKVPGMVDTTPGANREKVNGTVWNGQGWRFRISEMRCETAFG